MIYPPLDKIMENVDSRYTLVIATAKRARTLTVGENGERIDKPVVRAINEIYEGKVTFGDNIVIKPKKELDEPQDEQNAVEAEATEEVNEVKEAE